MKVELKDHVCIITREKDDPKYYGLGGESNIWYAIKVNLQKQGFDVIKKLMWKDGHLYGDDHTYYIRSRNLGKKFSNTHEWFQIYDNDYAIRAMTRDFNEGELSLMVARGDD
jgi:hypothetical protein